MAAVLLSIFSTVGFAATQSFWAIGNSDAASQGKFLRTGDSHKIEKAVSIAYELGSNWTNISAKLWLKAVDDSFAKSHCTKFSCDDSNGVGQDGAEQAVITKIEDTSGSFSATEINAFGWYDLGLDVTKYLLSDIDNLFTANVGASKRSDFFFKNAKLVIDYDLKSVPVPAAVWLFVPALIGLMGVKRKA